MQQTFFSIIVVSLNPGQRLKKTLDSIKRQSFTDYEVIVKDGGSKDGSLQTLQEEGYFDDFPKSLVIEKSDQSIYDAMNQALAEISGKYVQFLNCGDSFYGNDVLSSVFTFIKEQTEETPAIYYGSQYNEQQSCIVASAPQMNDFACYRNVPCHQVCFYDSRLFAKRGYLSEYTVRADYEHFLYCFYEEKAKTFCMPHVICFYEGGGYSETAKNRKISARQHREITKKYMGRKALCYRLIMLLTLAPLRTKLSQSKYFSHFYNAIKTTIYKKRR